MLAWGSALRNPWRWAVQWIWRFEGRTLNDTPRGSDRLGLLIADIPRLIKSFSKLAKGVGSHSSKHAPVGFDSGCTGSRVGKQQLIDEASHLECSNSIQLPNLSIIYTHCFRPPHCLSELVGGDDGGHIAQRGHETTHHFRYSKSVTRRMNAAGRLLHCDL